MPIKTRKASSTPNSADSQQADLTFAPPVMAAEVKPQAGSNLPEMSVSDLSQRLRRTVEDAFGLVRVRGEIGECKLHSSGHLYLSLKDESAVLAAVCWRGQVSKLGIKPQAGMEVICTGRITTYAGQSKYQMVVEGMELAGAGALLKMLDDRRRKLAAEGLFANERKRKLPFLPTVIGVITSPTGAVIRDILHRLDDRFPRHVIVWPVAVQGENAARQIVAAIRGFNALGNGGRVPRPDLLIVARGGGSLEDLMPFNEEDVVRAVAASAIPIISAVGHETDTTLTDFAADVRAPTPTAAAEMAVPVRDDLLSQVATAATRLDGAMRRMTRNLGQRLELTGRALGDPARVLEPLVQRLDDRTERLEIACHTLLRRLTSRLEAADARLRHPREIVAAADHRLQSLADKMQARGREQLLKASARLDRTAVMLEALSPRGVLGRGYALVYDAQGHVVTTAVAATVGSKIAIEWQDGKVAAEIS